MSRIIKPGDPIVVIGYRSVLAALIVDKDSGGLTHQDMVDPHALIHTTTKTGGWGICPADCHYVASGTANISTMNGLTTTMEKYIKGKGYYWAIKLQVILPKRSLRRG